MTSPIIKKPFVLVITGSSLTTGYLSADWVPTLQQAMLNAPERQGPVYLYNRGSGGQTSDWGRTNAAPLTAPLAPTHVLFEDFSINDAVDLGSGPAVSLANHDVNLSSMCATWRGYNAAVDLTVQTMSSVNNYTLRPTLPAYYADTVAWAALNGIRCLDHFPGWPNPLPQNLTHIDPTTGLGDGLHPIWPGADDTYLYPSVLAWARARMAEFWTP